MAPCPGPKKNSLDIYPGRPGEPTEWTEGVSRDRRGPPFPRDRLPAPGAPAAWSAWGDIVGGEGTTGRGILYGGHWGEGPSERGAGGRQRA